MLSELDVTPQGRIIIPPSYVLTSRTDLFGTITDASDDFAHVCGYSREELIGQPHNIIRHADVPANAFKDLWDTLKQGRSWQCIVKNRARNGNHYWVVANASPIRNPQGEIVEYISVRTPATEEQIALAESLYPLLHTGAMALEGGVPLTKGQLRREKFNPFVRLRDWQLRSKANALLLAFLLPLAALVFLSLNYIDKQVRALWVEDIAQTVELAARTELRYTEPKMQQVIITAQNTQTFRTLSRRLVANPQDIAAKAEMESYLVENFSSGAFGRGELSGLGIRMYDAQFNLLAQGIKAEGWNPGTQMNPDYKARALARNRAESMTPLTFLHTQDQRPVYSIVMPYGGLRVLGYLELMVDPAHNLREVERILGLPLQITLLDGQVFYTSDKWQDAEGQEDIIWQYVARQIQDDQQNPLLQLNVKQNITEFANTLRWTEYTVMTLFGMAILLIALVILFALKKLMAPINTMMQAMENASRGHFTQRIVARHSRDELGRMVESYNNLMNASQLAVVSVSQVLRALSAGRFDERIGFNSEGDLERLKQVTNGSMDRIALTFETLNKTLNGLSEGQFKQVVHVDEQIEGEFKCIIEGVVSVMVCLQSMVDSLVAASSSMAQGDFSHRINEAMPGELNTLRMDFNKGITDVETALNEIVQVTRGMSQGDLTQQVAGDYQGNLGVLKQAVNESISQLARTAQGLIESADVVSRMTEELTQGSGELSARTQQQAAALEQTSASMQQMTSSIDHASKNSSNAARLSLQLQQEAESGAKTMEDTIQSMQRVSAVSTEISEITALIDAISFQTNLLALNAAVEAARAGEHGRGFAVVAGEVRALAQKSAAAAQDIRHKIDSNVQQIKQSAKLVDQSSHAFNTITQGVVQVNELVVDIAQASSEQARGVQEVSQAIDQIDGVGQQNAALVEETTAATEELSRQASDLRSMASTFQVAKNLGHYIPPKALL
ncbi:methyl-accepting chemotaxis protein [Thiomicrospira microaerophila]|uniref:methyl-accepting chemotaxis protein n=1 Tax=Thiomicrospira microaerophila TaxID=406020 RepID=UPI0005CA6C41|nr:methyl-accepting chemotaxis protein [Thiomicrospira microaerophila]